MEENYLEDIKKLFRYYKTLGEKAMKQVPEKDLFWRYDEQTNSIAIIVQHISGNMLSRFTDFLSADGEKQWRERDQEFEVVVKSKKEVEAIWDKGWQCLLDSLNDLEGTHLQKIIYIRNTGHTVSEALNRQLAHYASHIGQIVFLAKMILKNDWKTLSIAKGTSKEFNAKKFSEKTKRQHFTDDFK